MSLLNSLSRREFVKLGSAVAVSAGVGSSALADPLPAVTTYPVPQVYRDKLSTKFRLTVHGQEIPVLRYIGKNGFVHTAHFTLEGAASFVVEATEAIHDWKLGPIASVISPTVSGKRLTFDVSGPKYLVLQLNGEKELLCIVAEPPETGAPDPTSPTVVDAGKAKIDNTGKDLVTAQVQGLIDRAAAIPGGIAYFPPGAYRVGLIELHNNSSLYLAPGAYLLGSPSEKDFVITGTQERGKRGTMTSTTVVQANGVHNIRIFGRGIIDGNAWNSDAKSQFRGALNVVGCNGVQLDGITLANSTMWTAVAFSRDIKIDGLKSIHDTQTNETDGLDICSCVNVDIGHSLLLAGDDAFCVKGSGDVTGSGGMASTWGWRGKATPPENTTLHNSVLFSGSAALKLGIQATTAIRNITFRDLNIVRGHRGISITHEQGEAAIEHIIFDNIMIDQIERTTAIRQISNCPISISYGRSSKGVIRDILLRNVTIREWGPEHSDIQGNGGSVENVRFENVSIAGVPVTSAEAGHIDVSGDAKGVTFK